MNRHQYSNKTISTYEIVGAYFVDIFYNHLYVQAQTSHKLYQKEGERSQSVTECYKLAIKAYREGITKNKNYYEQTIKGILSAYQIHTKHSTISMSDFIDNILLQFLPEEHFNVLSESQKHYFLNHIITNIINKFIDYAIQLSFLSMVIDNRNNTENTRVWMDHIVQIMILERETLFNRFVQINKRNSTNETVPVEVVRKLTAEKEQLWEQLQACVERKHKLTRDLNRARKVAEELYIRLESLSKQNAELQFLNREMRMINTTDISQENLAKKTMEHKNNVNSITEDMVMKVTPRNNPQKDTQQPLPNTPVVSSSTPVVPSNTPVVSSSTPVVSVETNSVSPSSPAAMFTEFLGDIGAIEGVKQVGDSHDDTTIVDATENDDSDPLAEAKRLLKSQASTQQKPKPKKGVRALSPDESDTLLGDLDDI